MTSTKKQIRVLIVGNPAHSISRRVVEPGPAIVIDDISNAGMSLLDSDFTELENKVAALLHAESYNLVRKCEPTRKSDSIYQDSRFNQKPEKSTFVRKINRSTKRW